MSKARERAMEQAITQAVALRRKVVDCRFDRSVESILLDKASEMIEELENNRSAQQDGEHIQENV